jgi:hypothetical protein
MTTKKTFIYILLGLFLMTAFSADAQRRNKYSKKKKRNKSVSNYHGGRSHGRFKPYSYAGVNVNALNYYGDLAPTSGIASSDVSFTRPGFGFNMGSKVSPSIALRGGLNWGRIAASDNSADPDIDPDKGGGRYQRNLSFRNDIYELQLGAEFYFMPNHGGANARLPFNGYFFVGGALFYHNPKGLVPDFDYQIDNTGKTAAPKAGEWVSLRALGTEGQNIDGYAARKYSPIQVSIPIGIGVRMRIPGTPFDAGLEVGYRLTFTDYLDDVKGQYVPLDKFDDPLARIMSDRSSERVDALTGENRTFITYQGTQQVPRQLQFGDEYYYVDALQGGAWTPEGKEKYRGNPNNNDIYIVTTLKLTYILGSKVRTHAKFR